MIFRKQAVLLLLSSLVANGPGFTMQQLIL